MLFEANVMVYALVAFGLYLKQSTVNPIRVNPDLVPKVVKNTKMCVRVRRSATLAAIKCEYKVEIV